MNNLSDKVDSDGLTTLVSESEASVGGQSDSHAVGLNTPPRRYGHMATLWCRRGLTNGGQAVHVFCAGITGTMFPLSDTMFGQPSAAL